MGLISDLLGVSWFHNFTFVCSVIAAIIIALTKSSFLEQTIRSRNRVLLFAIFFAGILYLEFYILGSSSAALFGHESYNRSPILNFLFQMRTEGQQWAPEFGGGKDIRAFSVGGPLI